MTEKPDIEKVQLLMRHKAVRMILWALQVTVVLGVLYLMIAKLMEIGWHDVWHAMPQTPWFYIFFLAMYFAQPVSEWLVYQQIWGPVVKPRFDIFLRMRIYNFALVSIAGEAWLALWAHKNLARNSGQLMCTIKDSNILSGLASNSFTLALLATFFLTGQLEIITNADPRYGYYMGLAVAVGLVLVPLVLVFHRRILGITPELSKKVFLLHLTRLVAVLLLQTGQWAVVFPDVEINTWLLLLTAQMVLTRVPFLPNTDLLFAGLGLSLMGYIDGPDAAIAGMFLASGALSQILNVGFFIATSFRGKPVSLAANTTSTITLQEGTLATEHKKT